MVSVKFDDKLLQAQLLLLELKPMKRRNMLRKIIRKLKTKTRQRLRTQTDYDGKKFAPRKDGSKKKMLRKLARHMKDTATANDAKLYFANPVVSSIAYAQQHGLDETVRASDFKPVSGDKNASRAQAKTLLKLGYKTRADGKLKRVSQRWIMSNLSSKQAGAIIRAMRKTRSKRSWIIPGTARAFLGANQNDILDILTELEADLLASVN